MLRIEYECYDSCKSLGDLATELRNDMNPQVICFVSFSCLCPDFPSNDEQIQEFCNSDSFNYEASGRQIEYHI